MNFFVDLFRSSALELKKIQSMVIMAMFVSLHVVLHMAGSIPISNLVEIRFTFIAIVFAGAWYGPVGGMSVAVLGDILSYLAKPTGSGYFPGFTLNAMVIGLIYGMLLYKQSGSAKGFLIRLMIAKTLCALVTELVLTPIWLSMMYGNAVVFIQQVRIIKSIIFLPIDVAIAYAVVYPLSRRFRLFARWKENA